MAGSLGGEKSNPGRSFERNYQISIYLANLDAKSLHVFCSKADISVHNVIKCPGLGKDKKIKVHFKAAVSMKHGPLYFIFTSCTRAGKAMFQGMKRIDWERRDGPNPDHPGLTSFQFPAEYKRKDDAQATAKSTTTEEFLDNLGCILKEWQRREGAGSHPMFMFDNNKIQKVADITQLRDALGRALPASCKLTIPAYSPDLNRAIEHMFGWLKNQVRHHMYKWLAHHPNSVPSLAEFAGMVHGMSRGDAEGIAQIAADFKSLPVLWQVLQHGKNVLFMGYDGRLHKGCWGDWPPRITAEHGDALLLLQQVAALLPGQHGSSVCC